MSEPTINDIPTEALPVPLWWCVVHHGHASSPAAGGCCAWVHRDECRAVQCLIPTSDARSKQ